VQIFALRGSGDCGNPLENKRHITFGGWVGVVFPITNRIDCYAKLLRQVGLEDVKFKMALFQAITYSSWFWGNDLRTLPLIWI